MLFKIKKIPTDKIIVGMEAMKLAEGSIVRCTHGGHKGCNEGDILERTSNDDKPFIALVGGPNPKSTPFVRGQLWGNSLEGYKFIHLEGRTRYDFPPF